MSIAELACAGLEEALNQYIALDPKAAEQLAQLHGRVIALEIAGPEIRLFLVPGPGRLQVMHLHEGEPDCLLRGSPLALARLGSAKEKAGELFGGQIEISGDTELGRRFGEILGALEIDWEEELACHTGDFIAHDIVSGARFLAEQGRRSLDNLGQHVKEYAQSEGQLLPTQKEVQLFLSKIDTLRDDMERLQARFDRLRSQISTRSNNNEKQQ